MGSLYFEKKIVSSVVFNFVAIRLHSDKVNSLLPFIFDVNAEVDMPIDNAILCLYIEPEDVRSIIKKHHAYKSAVEIRADKQAEFKKGVPSA